MQSEIEGLKREKSFIVEKDQRMRDELEYLLNKERDNVAKVVKERD